MFQVHVPYNALNYYLFETEIEVYGGAKQQSAVCCQRGIGIRQINNPQTLEYEKRSGMEEEELEAQQEQNTL